MCPSGYNCEHVELTSYIIPEDKDAIDCLLCFGVNENPFDLKSDYQINSKKLLDLHNTARASFPEECPDCPVFQLDSAISFCAQWFAQDMANKDYYSHKDSNDEFVWHRYNHRGIDWSASGENIGWIQKDYTLSDEEALDIMFSNWMNSPHHRDNILDARFTRIGFGMAKREWQEGGIWRRKYYFVANFADKSISSDLLIPKPDEQCTDECLKQVRWHQKYDVWPSGGPGGGTYKELYPYLLFDLPIIETCNLKKLTLTGNMSGLLGYVEFEGKGGIPDDNSLKYIWGDWAENTGRYLKIEYTKDKPFPGESILLWAVFQDYTGKCNPTIIGYTWFETNCFTSGVVQGICRGDDCRDELPDEWLSETDMMYKVRYKGDDYFLKSSDYALYKKGDRCIIYKGGLSQINKEGELVIEPACRGPVPTGGSMFEDGDEISDATVSYKLDIEKDVVVPVHFWNEGA